MTRRVAQVCAAKGALHGQNGGPITFAFAPRLLEPARIGSCGGFAPSGCGTAGYASSDIYYLEVCMYSVMCANGHSLFRQSFEVGEGWRCDLDWERFQKMRDWILAGLG